MAQAAGDRSRATWAGLALAAGLACAGAAEAKDPACPTRPIRWMEDCGNLADIELHGLDRLRYRPLTADGGLWLSMGGEARVRMDALMDVDYGINGEDGYVMTAGRLMAHADLRTKAGPRLFTQLVVMEENNRKPAARAQDESEVDVSQMFVDAPFRLGGANVMARLGRQEVDLSANRLITTRDGATARRAFQGVKVDVSAGGGKLALVSGRPIELLDDAFSDRPDENDRFSAVSLDLPRDLVPGGGSLNLFAFDRLRHNARFLRSTGDERRYTFGFHYADSFEGWQVDAQWASQVGKASGGRDVRAYGAALTLDRELDLPGEWAVGLDAVAASGDRVDTAAVETFDPLYPNNGGLSDATLFFQTNFVYAGGGVTKRWKGAILAANANLLARHSVTDGVYTAYITSRAIPNLDNRERLTSLLMQVSVRKALTPNTEVYASLVHGEALGGISAAGGRDVFYSRVQLTARF